LSNKSSTSLLIDSIAKGVYSAILKPIGYRKVARNFSKQSGDLYQVVSFQSSWLNTPDEAQFAVNLHITLPFFAEIWSGREFPSNPGQAANLVQVRLNKNLPLTGDHWWKITPKSDPLPLIDDISHLLVEKGLEFLDERTNLEWILMAVAGKKSKEAHPLGIVYPPEVVHAILMAYFGKVEDAYKLLNQAKLNEKSPWQGYDIMLERLRHKPNQV
jgi:hypothetical protein